MNWKCGTHCNEKSIIQAKITTSKKYGQRFQPFPFKFDFEVCKNKQKNIHSKSFANVNSISSLFQNLTAENAKFETGCPPCPVQVGIIEISMLKSQIIKKKLQKEQFCSHAELEINQEVIPPFVPSGEYRYLDHYG